MHASEKFKRIPDDFKFNGGLYFLFFIIIKNGGLFVLALLEIAIRHACSMNMKNRGTVQCMDMDMDGLT